MAFQIKAKLVDNRRIQGNYFRCALYAPGIVKEAGPGQFIMLKVGEPYRPLLRRPLGIHSAKGKRIEILYEAVGPGTEILSRKKPGECLDIIGPLGNGFDWQSPVASHQSPVLVAGGMGVAPLLFLAEKLVTRSQSLRHKPWRIRQEFWRNQVTRKPLVLIGVKTKSQILCEKEFKKLGCGVKISTDDGSRGYKGKITDLLKEFLLRPTTSELRSIYACGPRPMLKEICLFAKEYNLPAQVSLEEHMACGIGACFGCVVDTRQGFKRVCKEGPVFNADEIVWGNTH